MSPFSSWLPGFAGASLVVAATFAYGGLEKSGHASMELVTEKTGYAAGKPVRVALRMVMDPHWHSYWENPGEGGMKLQVEWQNLPAGWKASEPGYPVPKRMKTGDLAGFGYEGEVWFPIELTPGATSVDPVELVAKVSWLTCNDDACIPGDVIVKASLNSGGEAGPRATEVAKAFSALPQPWNGAKLAVEELAGGKTVRLRITPPADQKVDLASALVFPATESSLDPGAQMIFKQDGEAWVAETRKSEYASGALKALRLVLSGGGLPSPVWIAFP